MCHRRFWSENVSKVTRRIRLASLSQLLQFHAKQRRVFALQVTSVIESRLHLCGFEQEITSSTILEALYHFCLSFRFDDTRASDLGNIALWGHTCDLRIDIGGTFPKRGRRWTGPWSILQTAGGHVARSRSMFWPWYSILQTWVVSIRVYVDPLNRSFDDVISTGMKIYQAPASDSKWMS